MGNSQGSNVTTRRPNLVIQYPNGRTERLYCKSVISAGEIMEIYPGHYVMQTNHPGHYCSYDHQHHPSHVNAVSFKLLRSHESLVFGCAYRLVTTQEVMKVMRAKKYGGRTEISRAQREREREREREKQEKKKVNSVYVAEESNGKSLKFGAATTSKSWRPSLHSISEAM